MLSTKSIVDLLVSIPILSCFCSSAKVVEVMVIPSLQNLTFFLIFAVTIASYFIVAEQTILECSRKASYAASVEKREQAAARSEAA
jgi:hypothetical protein